MKKFAVMSRDKTRWNGHDFHGFIETETEAQACIEIDKYWVDCDCDLSCYCEEEDLEDCQCQTECDCEFWPQEVAIDIISYNSYTEKFYTQLQLLEKQVEEIQNSIERHKRIEKNSRERILELQRQLIKCEHNIITGIIELTDAETALQKYKNSLAK